jgi:hypothetical protein
VTYHKERDELQEGVIAGLLGVRAHGPLHHGVLPHEHHRVGAQPTPDVLQLLGADIVRLEGEGN